MPYPTGSNRLRWPSFDGAIKQQVPTDSTPGDDDLEEVPIYSGSYPTLQVVLPDHVVLSLDDKLKRGMAIRFDMLKTEHGSSMSVENVSNWRVERDDSNGSRTPPREPGYIGYVGKRVKINANFNDNVSGSALLTQTVINQLYLFMHHLVRKVRYDTPVVDLVIQTKPGLSDITISNIKFSYKDKLETGTVSANMPKYEKLVNKVEKRPVERFEKGSQTMQPVSIETVEDMKNPFPPLPLRFSYGGFVLYPCVIDRLSVSDIRHNLKIVRSCNIQMVLNEIATDDHWSVPTDLLAKRWVQDVVTTTNRTEQAIYDTIQALIPYASALSLREQESWASLAHTGSW